MKRLMYLKRSRLELSRPLSKLCFCWAHSTISMSSIPHKQFQGQERYIFIIIMDDKHKYYFVCGFIFVVLFKANHHK